MSMAVPAPYVAPLCPAGHLPLKGGDHAFVDAVAFSPTLPDGSRRRGQLISPLVGEMSGRTEGGNVGRHPKKAFPSERFPG